MTAGKGIYILKECTGPKSKFLQIYIAKFPDECLLFTEHRQYVKANHQTYKLIGLAYVRV